MSEAIDLAGYALIGLIVPFIVDMTGSWVNVFYCWAIMPLAIIVLVGFVYVKGRSKWLEKLPAVAE